MAVFNIVRGETACSTAKAVFALCAHGAAFASPGSRGVCSSWFSPLLGAEHLCVCASRDTYALAYLPGSVTHPGAMLLPQSGGGGSGLSVPGGVQGHTSLLPKTKVRTEPCPAVGTHRLVVSRGDWQEGGRTLQQWQCLQESDLFFSLLSPTLNRFATISTAGTASQPQIRADNDLLS